MKKRFLAAILCVTLLFSMTPWSNAIETNLPLVKEVESGETYELTTIECSEKYPVYYIEAKESVTQLQISNIENGAVRCGTKRTISTLLPEWIDLEYAMFALAGITCEDYGCENFEKLAEIFGYTSAEELYEVCGIDLTSPSYGLYVPEDHENYKDGIYSIELDSPIDENTFHRFFPEQIFDSTAKYYQINISKFFDNIDSAKENYAQYFIVSVCLVKVGGQETVQVDKSILSEKVRTAPKSSEGKYYQTDDRFNGVTTSQVGFWEEYSQNLKMAEKILADEVATQESVNSAVNDLSNAIDNLIPIDQINPTALYETLQTYSGGRYQDASMYSSATWVPFNTARKVAQELLDSLYDSDGNPTAENQAGRQSEADAAAQKLIDTGKALDYVVDDAARADSENALAGIRLYLAKCKDLKQTAYTTESWSSLQSAVTEAERVLQENGRFLTTMGSLEKAEQSSAFKALRQAFHGLVGASAAPIQVHVSVVDNYRFFRNWTSPSTYASTWETTLQLKSGSTVADAMDQVGPINRYSSGNNAAVVYLNGMLFYDTGGLGYYGGTTIQAREAGLQDGDELVFALMYLPQYQHVSEQWYDVEFYQDTAQQNLRYLTLDLNGPADKGTYYEVQAGKPFTMCVASTPALPALYEKANGVPTPYVGGDIRMSETVTDEAQAGKAHTYYQSGFTTDANGEAEVTLYAEGWVILNAMSAVDVYNYREDPNGLVNGPNVRVHVLAGDLAEIKVQLKKELETAAKDPEYPEEIFSEADWKKIADECAAGIADIESAKTSGDARDVQLTRLTAIKNLQQSAVSQNNYNLNRFREQLAKLPSDLSKLDQSLASVIETMKECYDKMTVWQLNQLTDEEKSIYEQAIKAVLGEAVEYSLRVEYDLSAVPEADRAGLTAMLDWLKANTANESKTEIGGSKMAELYSFNTAKTDNPFGSPDYTPLTKAAAGTSVAFCSSPEYAAHMHIHQEDGHGTLSAADGSGWSITDHSTFVPNDNANRYTVYGNMDYVVNGHSYAMRGITVKGIAEQDVSTTQYGFFDTTNCYGKNPGNQTFLYMDGSFRWFKMPFEDVVFTISWAPAGGTDTEVASAKAAAISAIQSTYDGYNKASYTEENLALLAKAKDDGIAAVNAANTLDAVQAARRAALDAMAAIPETGQQGPGTGLPDMGKRIGKVHITVENTTYPSGAFTGKLLAGTYDLCERDSMMTVVLKALASEGYTWEGTGGSGYDISYIGSISKDLNGDGIIDKAKEQLGEFSGAAGSGWMGTINDFFTNEGFNGFSVPNGKLGNNDEICIMFTQNLGADIGGTWSNSDTSLMNLVITGTDVELTPAFEKERLNYDLIIPGARSNIVVTPTASNKNYMVKTFLNEYDTDYAFYKRTESISVTSNDTVYVGCGEYHWPSMNNQGAEARPYTGTKYILHVYTDDAAGVQARINALPDAAKLTLANYSEYKAVAERLRADCNKLGDSAGIDDTRLTALENRIKFLQEIEKTKAMIAALPSPSVIDANREQYRSQVNAAKEAYDGLSALQRMQFSTAEVAKLNNACAALGAADDDAAAARVRELINALPSVEAITAAPETHAAQVRAAKAAYDDLTETQKAKLTPDEVKRLTDAVAALEAALEGPTDDDVKAVQAFIEKLEAIGNSISVDSEKAISDARSAYEALTEKQKSYVDSGLYETLLSAEKVLEVVKQIAAIAPVTKDNMAAEEPKIEAARSAYNALSEAEKAMVSNYDHLTEQEANLKVLKDTPPVDTSLYSEQLQKVLAYIAKEVPRPTFGTNNGEWSVLAQARAGTLSSSAKTSYLLNLKSAVDRLNGRLDDTEKQLKHTEYERVILALASIGINPASFAGNNATYDFVAPLLDISSGSYKYQVSEQGNNGTIFALIALDAWRSLRKTDYTSEETDARENWITTLLKWQLSDGSWPIYNSNQSGEGSGDFAEGSSIDVTAMALQALAPYYNFCNETGTYKLKPPAGVNTSDLIQKVNKALNYLSRVQGADGGYGSCEGNAQVIVALSALGRDAAKDSAFTKNGWSVLSNLLTYFDSTGGFRHIKGGEINAMATDQAAYALVAYDRYLNSNSKTALYNMSDVTLEDKPVDPEPEKTYTVTARVNGGNGTITPDRVENVKAGTELQFTITPNSGYEVDTIKVDGKLASNGFSLRDNVPAEPGACVHELLYEDPIPATCAENGVSGYWVCGLCGDAFLDEAAEIPVTSYEMLETEPDPFNHVAEAPLVLGAVKASCIRSGYSGDSFCSGCGELLRQGEVIPQGGHSYASGWYADAEGHWKACTVCGEQVDFAIHVYPVFDEPEPEPVDPIVPEPSDPEIPEHGEPDPVTEPGDGEGPAPDDPGTEENNLLSMALLEDLGSGEDGTVSDICTICGYHADGTSNMEQPAPDDSACGSHYFSEWVNTKTLHWQTCEFCGLADTWTVSTHNWMLDEYRSTEDLFFYTCVCGAEKQAEAPAAFTPAAQAYAPQADELLGSTISYFPLTVTGDNYVEVTFRKLSPAIPKGTVVSGTTATASVTEKEMEDALSALKAGGGDYITILPDAPSFATEVVVNIPSTSVDMAARAGAGVTVWTDLGTVSIPSSALANIPTSGAYVAISVRKASPWAYSGNPSVSVGDNSAAMEVTVTVNGSPVTSFGGWMITVSIPVNNTFHPSEEYDVTVIHSDGMTEVLKGRCVIGADSLRYVEVSVNRLSVFIVNAGTGVHKIFANYGLGGRIAPYGETEVKDGENIAFDIQANDGYEIDRILLDGRDVRYVLVNGYETELTDNSHIERARYVLENVTEDHTIQAEFRRGVKIPDYGRVIGTVSITIENRTFPGGAFYGNLVSGTYDLCERDTMMTSILKALTLNGYTWEGTGGTSADGYDITYISYIKQGSRKLGEFSGERGSGWMGTLNDWFTNEGFQSFRVGGRGTYALEDGDEICVMFTQNLGADISGSWNNSDTRLKSLSISGGTLSPSFASGTLEYTLTVPDNGASIRVTPAAANKNYLVKTFLNTYNSDSAYYKRTRSIPVKPGDVIYIGVGDKSWPSMNNQGAEATDYTGTTYTIRVVGTSFQSRIDALPKADEITYENYKGFVKLVEDLRADYERLSASEKAKLDITRLVEAEERIKYFPIVDDVKDLLNDIPNVADLTETQAESLLAQVRAAYAAYDALDAEQKDCFYLTDVTKYNAAVEWLEKLGYKTDGLILATRTDDSASENETPLPFWDVGNHWGVDGIRFVYERGLMRGVSDYKFDPEGYLSRAMLVTILYRMEGEPAAATATYGDVPANTWYTNAVAWASANGIVNGVGDNKYAPNANITRDEMATMMLRYAKYKGYDTTATMDLGSYADQGQVREWAYRAMQWAGGTGLITGRTAATLAPQGTATRAETATILMRFLQRFASNA